MMHRIDATHFLSDHRTDHRRLGRRAFAGGLVVTIAAPVLGLNRVIAASPFDVLRLHAEPRPIPDIAFIDGDGRPLRLSDFRGRVVLLNVWATWCIPCRKEMPTLNLLQAELGGPEFEVVALSIDRGGPKTVAAFYDEYDLTRLKIYIAPSPDVMGGLAVAGLPTTLLIDREGREVSRYVGPATWNDPAIVEMLRRHIARPRSEIMRNKG
jgi:thiol-disulfide isomerase/thioredoxin